jgi:membrane-bound lytic murein transglycosylase D
MLVAFCLALPLAMAAQPPRNGGHKAGTLPANLMADRETDDTVALMDSLLESYQRNIRYKRIQATPKPEPGRFAEGELPQYPADVYEQRMREICSIVPLDFNPVVQKFIEAYTLKHRDVVSRALGMQHVFFPMIEEVFEREGVPLEMKYLCIPESAFYTRARSRAAAVGLWQFMIYTARQYGLRVDSYIDERQDPYKATVAAARYLKDLYGVYNDWHLVMAAYNCGPGWVNRGIRLTGGKTSFWEIYRYLPWETRGYVPSYIAVVYSMHYAKEHNIGPEYTDFSFDVDSIRVANKEVSLEWIAKATGTDLTLLQDLNPELRLYRIPFSSAPYKVRVPKKTADFVMQYPDTIYKEKVDPRTNSAAQLNAAMGAVPPGSKLVYHTVRQGQTLGHISEYYGVSVYNLMDWNNKGSTFINIGEVLRVYVNPVRYNQLTQPAPKAATAGNTNSKGGNYRQYTVKNGDTLWDIAQKYPGVTVEQIAQLNSLSRNARLTVGQVLKLPL